MGDPRRAAALEKLARGRSLITQAETELRAVEEEEGRQRATPGPAKVTDMDRVRARKALQRLGYKA